MSPARVISETLFGYGLAALCTRLKSLGQAKAEHFSDRLYLCEREKPQKLLDNCYRFCYNIDLLVSKKLQ